MNRLNQNGLWARVWDVFFIDGDGKRAQVTVVGVTPGQVILVMEEQAGKARGTFLYGLCRFLSCLRSRLGFPSRWTVCSTCIRQLNPSHLQLLLVAISITAIERKLGHSSTKKSPRARGDASEIDDRRAVPESI